MIFMTIFFAGFIYVNDAFNQVTYVQNEDISNVEILDETFDIEPEINPALTIKPSDLNWTSTKEEISPTIKPETSGITNILLCGEENISGAKRGRTDCMIIASINMNTGTMRLISFMRDLYVPIEGHSNNKLNASYAIGGMPLLISTLEDDFDIQIDGYILVDFAQFENLIDLLGGVDITLSEKEVKYLNENNYISDEKNRILKVGKQTLNGNQALGYSRIRYVSTPNGLANDFGRVWRQKQVILSIYEKYKNISYAKMLELLPEVLSLVTTDLTKDELLQLGINVLSLRNAQLEQACVPYEGTYSCANVNGMSVLYIEDIEEIRAKTNALINGANLEETIENKIANTNTNSEEYYFVAN